MKDFIWAEKNDPHAERRAEILKKHPEIKKLMRYEPLTKYIATSLILIQFLIAFSFKDDDISSLSFWMTSYVIGGSMHAVLLLCSHEASHNLCFKKIWHNKCFGIFMNLPIILPHFTFFKFYHTDHHKRQGEDGVDADLPTELEAKLLSTWKGKLFFWFFNMWFYAFRPLLISFPPINRWTVVNYLTQIIFTMLVHRTLGIAPIAYLLASDHFSGSIHPFACHYIAEHYVFDSSSETYSYYGPMNWLTINVGYHNEHHDFPSVPWSKLPEVHKIAEETYKKLPHHTSYSALMWEFISNPEISLYSRVKRRRKDN